jgi:hypothetical protein
MFRLLLTLFLLTAPSYGGWAKKRTITIDHTKVISTDHTNFPVLICFNGVTGSKCDGALGTLSVPNLKGVGDGGVVTDADGDDIILAATGSNCATTLTFEREKYTSSTGEWVGHLNQGTLSSSSDDTIDLCYGNSAVTTYQGDTNGTWNSAFKVVHHYSTASLLGDSTSNGKNGTGIGSNPPIASSVSHINGALYSGGGTESGSFGDGAYTISDTGLPSGSSSITVEMWYNKPNVNWSDGYIWCLGAFATANQCFCASVRTSGTAFLLYNGNSETVSQTFTPGTWYHIVVRFNSSGTAGETFINGASVDTFTNASQNTTLNGTMYIGGTNPAVYNAVAGARMDEFRISNVARSDGWITTTYNSYGSPSSFYSVGAEASIGGAQPPRVMIVN